MDGNQLTGYVYELEVDDLTEDVQRGGLTIQKLDSETGARVTMQHLAVTISLATRTVL